MSVGSTSSSESSGSRSKSPRARWSSLYRLPTATDMNSASSRGSSVQKVNGVPQNPQKMRLVWGAWRGENMRRIEECVSSGKKDSVWDWYHSNGTRSHAVSGVP